VLKPYTYIATKHEQETIARTFPIAVGEPTCNACTRDDKGTNGRYSCTRPKGHPGELHVAHYATFAACAIWAERQ